MAVPQLSPALTAEEAIKVNFEKQIVEAKAKFQQEFKTNLTRYTDSLLEGKELTEALSKEIDDLVLAETAKFQDSLAEWEKQQRVAFEKEIEKWKTAEASKLEALDKSKRLIPKSLPSRNFPVRNFLPKLLGRSQGSENDSLFVSSLLKRTPQRQVRSEQVRNVKANPARFQASKKRSSNLYSTRSLVGLRSQVASSLRSGFPQTKGRKRK